MADRTGRVVDVGCGRGDLAAGFVDRGWTATGVEPSPEACAVARTRGVDARVGTLADVVLEPDAYDAAVFHHSLEHTSDPVGDLEKTHAALRPGGLALITVPNFGNWQPRTMRSRWYHLDLPRHRTHFTPDGLRRALTTAGYEVERITTSTSTVGLPASIQYALFGRCLFPGGLGLRIASGLCVLVLPLARLLDRRGGDQLHAVARKPALSEAGDGGGDVEVAGDAAQVDDERRAVDDVGGRRPGCAVTITATSQSSSTSSRSVRGEVRVAQLAARTGRGSAGRRRGPPSSSSIFSAGRLAHVADAGLVGDADQRDLRPVDRLARAR